MEPKPLERRINLEKIILIALCTAALLSFFAPAIRVDVNFLGRYSSTSLSMASIVIRPESPFATMDVPGLQHMGFSDFLDIAGENNPFADIGVRLITSIAAYGITAILLITILICTILGKLKMLCTILLAISLALYTYAGIAISTVPDAMQDALVSFLGILAMFINISGLVDLNLAIGYWLTLALILTMIIFETVCIIKNRITSEASQCTT